MDKKIIAKYNRELTHKNIEKLKLEQENNYLKERIDNLKEGIASRNKIIEDLENVTEDMKDTNKLMLSVANEQQEVLRAYIENRSIKEQYLN